MSRPVEYKLILANSEVLTLKAMNAKVQHRVDSVGLRTALLTFRNKEVLVLDYQGGRLSSMRLRGERTECVVPDSMFNAMEGVDLAMTFLTWPGDFKRACDADHFCIDLNYWLNESQLPRFEPKAICFKSDCSRIGSEMILVETTR
jgi:hypothetical protein